jgi:hypothetical protein
VYIAHDLWDGKFKGILGLRVLFIYPNTTILYLILVGLVREECHSATVISDEISNRSAIRHDLDRLMRDKKGVVWST